jgi:putative endonuclease
MPDARMEHGRHAEKAAAAYLLNHGFTIIKTNFRRRMGEIDIIARKGGCIHFIEIKSQSENSAFPAVFSWKPAQRKRFVRLAEKYLAENARAGGEGFDVSLDFMRVVTGDNNTIRTVELIEDAFRPE